jgi:hypothetical protein
MEEEEEEEAEEEEEEREEEMEDGGLCPPTTTILCQLSIGEAMLAAAGARGRREAPHQGLRGAIHQF